MRSENDWRAHARFALCRPYGTRQNSLGFTQGLRPGLIYAAPWTGLGTCCGGGRVWFGFSVGIGRVTSYRIDPSFLPSARERVAGSRPLALCRPYGTCGILALYPGLTPWAKFMPPRERGSEACLLTCRHCLT
jgi:hypothetical protein